MANKMSVEVGDKSLTFARVFQAPKELVFSAYTDAEAIKQWFGPETYPVTFCEIDLRPGGQWHYCMTGPNGEEAWGIATYTEIEPSTRLAYRDAFSDAERTVIPPEGTVTVTFEDHESGQTLLTARTLYPSNDERDQVVAMGVEEGIGQSFDNLDRWLETRK